MSTPPLLVCPVCREIYGGTARIGNRKSTCKLCNRFYQAVRRLASKLLADLYPTDAANATMLAREQIYLEMFGGETHDVQ